MEVVHYWLLIFNCVLKSGLGVMLSLGLFTFLYIKDLVLRFSYPSFFHLLLLEEVTL